MTGSGSIQTPSKQETITIPFCGNGLAIPNNVLKPSNGGPCLWMLMLLVRVNGHWDQVLTGLGYFDGVATKGPILSLLDPKALSFGMGLAEYQIFCYCIMRSIISKTGPKKQKLLLYLYPTRHYNCLLCITSACYTTYM